MILKPETREEWLQMRQEIGIGGSDAGTVLGMNPYCSNVQLWRFKAGLDTPEDISDKPAVIFGKKAEKNIRELFKLDYPEWHVGYHEFWMHVNDLHKWQFATLDGEITTPEGLRGILEIKTTTIMNKSQWDEWENRIPDRYFAQVSQHLQRIIWKPAISCTVSSSVQRPGSTEMPCASSTAFALR